MSISEKLPPAVASPSEAFDFWQAEISRAEEAVAERRARQLSWQEQRGWHVAEGGGCVGLSNMKNTCWMNSVIQSLAHVEPFTAHFLSGEDANPNVPSGTPSEALQHPSAASGAGSLQRGTCAADSAPRGSDFGRGESEHDGSWSSELRALLRQLWQENQRKAVRPSRFHSRLSLNASRGVEKSHKSQQDAQEFLLFILNALHEEFAATVPWFVSFIRYVIVADAVVVVSKAS
ncbi:unnamed protein product [Polarella glacialis]|uniref:USP domain-containing protein n=1 Tax=Polarella glacialis TaxID=89957 RepID=A0A813E927_POLGL|nr:unnamed protein product [Polarella glacialis]